MPETKADAQQVLAPDPWEAAYLRFETEEEEIVKFTRRLLRLGARQWPRDAEIVEFFCGRENGLIALQRLGFTRLEGVDLAPRLTAAQVGRRGHSMDGLRHGAFPALALITRPVGVVLETGGLLLCQPWARQGRRSRLWGLLWTLMGALHSTSISCTVTASPPRRCIAGAVIVIWTSKRG